jgi:hypothetical protein
VNLASGADVGIRGAHLAAIIDIELLFAAGSVVESHADKKGDLNITATRRIHAPIEFGGRDFTGRFTVKESRSATGTSIPSRRWI